MSGYQDVAAALRAAIEAGTYRPGDVLPKQDDIATEHGVNIHTVRKAVDLLATEGYVQPIRRRGTVVLDRAELLAVVRRLRALADSDTDVQVLVSRDDLRAVLDALPNAVTDDESED